jgi:hypothetical protein
MQRWVQGRRLWLLGSIAAVASLVFLLTFFGAKNRSPHRFLAAHHPVVREAGGGIERIRYSFKGDYAVFAERARTELIEEGYVDCSSDLGFTDDGLFFVSGDHTRLQSSSVEWVGRQVLVQKDVRLTTRPNRRPNHSYYREGGWIYVVVERPTPKTAFARFREWLGF